MSFLRRLFLAFAAAAFAAGAAFAPTVSRADTVASLLGNFTINQFCGLQISERALALHFVLIYGQLPALRELHLADADGNGVTTQAERDAYFASLAPSFADALKVRVDGVPVLWRARRWRSSLPTEQGGFSLRVDVDYEAVLPALGVGVHRLQLANDNYPGRIGWHEIVLEAKQVSVFDTNGYDTSLTRGLAEALKALPTAGPLDEREVHLQFTAGAPPAHAALLGPRPSAAPPVAAAADDSAANWIERRTHGLVAAISAPKLEPGVAILTLLGALLLGAVHALSPGHGKTIVGAYLIGSRGTPRHAVFLGITVTITHTLGVFLLGFATLYASRLFMPERLFPILSLISAVLVLGMGVTLLIQRARAARAALAAAAAGVSAFQPLLPVGGASKGYIFAKANPTLDSTLHSHGGGPLHSHLPPGAAGEKITWRSLLALGISGGLVPCPSAMVLLLAAVALNKTAYGMLLVSAFSVGLAVTLTLVGLAFLYARNRFARPAGGARWAHLMPVLSAGTITVIGVALCVGALRTFR